MTPHLTDEQFAELHDLITARLTEQITRAQLERLQTLINEKPAARRVYVQYMRDTVMLHCMGQETEGQDVDTTRELRALRESLLARRMKVEGQSAQAGKTHGDGGSLLPFPDAGHGQRLDDDDQAQHARVSHSRRSKAIAACIGVALIGLFALLLSRSGPPAPSQPVAILTETQFATWEDEQGRLIFIRDGSPLRPGQLNLADGLAKITFNDGAVVLLDARDLITRFELLTDSEGTLHVGRLTARVESEKARGFAVNAPGRRRAIDLGTAFGMIVWEDQRVEVHVFKGEVDYQLLGDEGEVLDSVKLRQSEARRVEPGATSFETVPAVAEAFAIDIPKRPTEADPPSGQVPPGTDGSGGTGTTTEKTEVLRLAGIVAGGDGRSLPIKPRGINPATGAMVETLLDDVVAANIAGDGQYHQVPHNPLVDGVFVPDGGSGAVQIDSAGHTFAGFPDTQGAAFSPIWPGIEHRTIDSRLGGTDYAKGEHDLLGMHASKAITFDLAAIRQAHGGAAVTRLTGIVGNTGPRTADFWVFIDGELQFSKRLISLKDGAFNIDLPIGVNARFLTLASTDGDNNNGGDWVLFGDAHVHLVHPTTDDEERSKE